MVLSTGDIELGNNRGVGILAKPSNLCIERLEDRDVVVAGVLERWSRRPVQGTAGDRLRQVDAVDRDGRGGAFRGTLAAAPLGLVRAVTTPAVAAEQQRSHSRRD